MDRQTLHDLGGDRARSMRRGGAEQRRFDEDEAARPNFPSSTQRTSTTSTGGKTMSRGQYPSSSVEDLAQHDSFDDVAHQSFRRGGSWDAESGDDESRRSPRVRDMRKTMDATTPTLIDEEDYGDDEEQEMVTLEHERLRQRAFFGGDDHLRRTPGAQMYRSNYHQQNVRRTPGASQMHRSAPVGDVQHKSDHGDASALGFGLTLSTPVAASGGAKPLDLGSQVTPHSTTDSSKAPKGARPPPAPGSYNREQKRGAFVATWNLAENLHLDTRRGSYSPNTLRLTEDLGNLLLEDDDGAEESNRKVSEYITNRRSDSSAFPTNDSNQEISESWTAPYVIGMEATSSRVPRGSSGRARRGRAETNRRGRADRPNSRQTLDQHEMAGAGSFLSNAQHPTPVRGGHTLGSFSVEQFGIGDSGQSNNLTYSTENEEATSAPRLLNFGGAFAPPAKIYGVNFYRPVPSSAPMDPNSVPFGQSTNAGVQSTFPTSPVFGAAFHSPFQQSQQPFGAHHAKFQPQYGAGGTLLGGNPGISHSPTFNFPPQDVGYTMQVPGMHPPPQDFMPNLSVHHHHRSPIPFPPQAWPQTVPMQFEGVTQMEQPNWPGSHGGWAMGEYNYGMPRSNDSGGTVAPPQNRKAEPEPMTPEMGTNPFSDLQKAGLSQASPTPQNARAFTRGKNNRKNSTKRGSKNQPKNQGGQKIDTSNQSSTGKKVPTTSSKTKKKISKDRSTPTTQNINNQSSSNLDLNEAPDETLAESKRAELVESPAIKSALKDFNKQFRAEEKTSAKCAEDFALKAVADGSLPESTHWKVYLELADLAKRTNRFAEARNLYQQACKLQPYACQGWLDYSKLEEECGNMNFCAKILKAGLEYCEYNDNLIQRAIKHEEKMGNLGRARELLSRLKHVGIDKAWRTVLEGALLEARAGNDVTARRVLKYLMHHVPWYGPLYLEAYKFEKDLGMSMDALVIVERGIATIPRYGPLWFGAFKLCEELDLSQANYELPLSMSMIDRATSNLSKDLIWKVHLEAAQMLERSSVENLSTSSVPTAEEIMNLSRKRFAMTILTCPLNQRWKVWLAAGRMEIAAGNPDRARNLFLRAHRVVPEKGRAAALLECARLEEFVGDTELASSILCKSRSVSGSDWKVWLESVLFEIRYGNYERATELALCALRQHSGTGRLWALLVQLRHFDKGEEAQFESLKFALNAVPKSGEVWCEGARIHLNPFSRSFDLSIARRHLFFATKFTPQYGDGFLESLRLEVLDQWLSPISVMIWEATKSHLRLSDSPNHDDALIKYVNLVLQSIRSLYCDDDTSSSKKDLMIESVEVFDEETKRTLQERLLSEELDQTVDISNLKLRCANADPNYGSLWFHCRAGPTDTARKILFRAVDLMLVELKAHAQIYLGAFLRRFAVLECLAYDRKQKHEQPEGNEETVEGDALFENIESSAYLTAPSLKDIIHSGHAEASGEAHVALLESAMSESSFVTGFVALSRQKPVNEMPFHERRRALFGTDSLFS